MPEAVGSPVTAYRFHVTIRLRSGVVAVVVGDGPAQHVRLHKVIQWNLDGIRYARCDILRVWDRLFDMSC